MKSNYKKNKFTKRQRELAYRYMTMVNKGEKCPLVGYISLVGDSLIFSDSMASVEELGGAYSKVQDAMTLLNRDGFRLNHDDKFIKVELQRDIPIAYIFSMQQLICRIKAAINYNMDIDIYTRKLPKINDLFYTEMWYVGAPSKPQDAITLHKGVFGDSGSLNWTTFDNIVDELRKIERKLGINFTVEEWFALKNLIRELKTKKKYKSVVGL